MPAGSGQQSVTTSWGHHRGPGALPAPETDVPGRGEPGSGSADRRGAVADLVDHGYRGLVALESVPRDSTERSLERLRTEVEGWLRPCENEP